MNNKNKEINENEKITKIYLVSNCFGDPNKVYIGKEKSHQKLGRKYPHKKTFGSDITFIYIDECNGWNKENWKPLECFWIEQFRQWGFELMNENKGGGGCEFHDSNSRRKLSESKKGTGTKKIIQYNLNGEFVKEWESLTEVMNEIGSISGCLNGKYITGHGFQWRYKDRMNGEIENLPPVKEKEKINIYIPIIQYDLSGNFIREWKSQQEASIQLNIGISNINVCLKNKVTFSGGFVWKYKTKNYPLKIEKPILGNNKPVLQFDLNDNFIREWESQQEVKKELKIKDISHCLVGRHKTAAGYKWKFKNYEK